MKNTVNLGLNAPNTYPSNLTREDIIRHINQIGDVFTMALKNNLDDVSFETVAAFSAEIIPHTVNGYQRFLDTITKGSTARVIAGFIIRFKCLLQVELGDDVLRMLEHELVTMQASDILAAEAGEGKDGTTLWKIAHPDLQDVRPPSEFDVLVTYLLLLQVKNLVIRASATAEIEKNTPRQPRPQTEK